MPGVSGRVLVVDDSKVIRQLIRVNLELEGFEVVTASDGAECLEIVHQVRPDVVTLDVVMPRLDGLRTAARLRADPGMQGLRIAIVSACTHMDLELGEAAGVDGYLGKPFEPVELVRLVRRLMHMERGQSVSPRLPQQEHPAHPEHQANQEHQRHQEHQAHPEHPQHNPHPQRHQHS